MQSFFYHYYFKPKKLTQVFAFLLINLFIFTLQLNAQNVLDDIEVSERGDESTSNSEPDLVKEKIVSISPTKKIFLLTNENQIYSKGDFITLLLNSKLAVRALVAKTTEEKIAGIKMIKIYSLNLWNQLKPGLEVQVLKGDDSYFSVKEKTGKETTDDVADSKIQDEADLFNDSNLLDEDGGFEENARRLIKTDNLVSFNVGLIEAKDNDGASTRYVQFHGTWAYQMSDNIWGELVLGTNVINDFPAASIDTRLTNITLRGKYTFEGPFFSYLQPYAGYQVINASSASAGVDDGRGLTTTQLNEEKDLVEDSAKSRLIFGVTFLKRIVPGWFARGDFGLDIVAGGLTLEF